jgi:CBS-domain-containing membrane protein
MGHAGMPVKVRDVMSTDVKTFVTNTSIADAARSLTLHRMSGAPVMDHGHVVGVVSKTDLVSPRKRAKAGDDGTVGQVMTGDVHVVRSGDPVMKAVQLMAEHGIHRVVVVDAKGKLAGMITAMDVVRALAQGRRIDADARVEPEDARE